MTKDMVKLSSLPNPAGLSSTPQQSGKEVKKAGSFEDALNKASLKKDAESQAKQEPVADKPVQNEGARVKENAQEKPVERKEDRAEEAESKEQPEKMEGGKSVQSVEGRPEGEDVLSEEIAGAIVQVQEAIFNVIPDITVEDLEGAMEALSLTEADLLKPEVLPALVAEIKGEDVSAVIADESLYAAVSGIKEVQQEVAGRLMQEMGLEPEEFKAVVDNIQLQPKEVAEEAPKDVIIVEDGPEGQETKEFVKDTEVQPKQTLDTVEHTEDQTVGTPAEAVKKSSDSLKPDRQPERAALDAPEAEEAPAAAEPGARRIIFEGTSGEKGRNADPGANQGNPAPAMSFEQNLYNAVEDNISMGRSEFVNSLERVQDIMNQVEEQLRINIKPDTTSVEMFLNPASLGRIALHLESNAGAVSAHFSAQNEAVKSALESQIVQLKQDLEAQGLKVESVEVTVASHAFEQNLMNGQGGNGNFTETEENSRRAARIRRIRVSGGEGEGEDVLPPLTEEEEIARDMMERSGNNVDFTA